MKRSTWRRTNRPKPRRVDDKRERSKLRFQRIRLSAIHRELV
jgi:hypothetical protein